MLTTRANVKVGVQPYLAGIFAAVVFCWISVWNGYPLVYEDTQSYLERPATLAAAAGVDSIWASHAKLGRLGVRAAKLGSPTPPVPAKGYDSTFKSGRSIYYGIFAYLLTCVGGLWAVVAGQAAALGLVLALLWYRCFEFSSDAGFIALVGTLAAATSAALFVNLVMPDLLAGLLTLSLAMLLAFWSRLGRADRAFLVAISCLSVVAHDSHLALAFSIVLSAAVGSVLITSRWRGVISRPALGAGALVVAVGVCASLIFGIAVTSITGQAPVRLPHLTAHLVSKPVLARFLDHNCGGPVPDWAVCAYRSRLPLVWTDFLFETRPGVGTFAVAGSGGKLAISEQDAPLMLAVLRAEPLQTLGMMLHDAGRQLAAFSCDDIAQRDKANYIDNHFPPQVRDAVHTTRLWRDGQMLGLLSAVEQAAVLIAMPVFIAALILVLRTGRRDGPALATLAAVVCFGVIANAFICGGLASPYDRFQARIVWLIPLAAFIAVAVGCRPGRNTVSRQSCSILQL